MLRWSIRLVHSLLLILLPHLRQVCCAPAAHLVHHRSYSCRCTMQTHSPCFYPTTRCKVLQSAGSHPKYCPQEKKIERKKKEKNYYLSTIYDQSNSFCYFWKFCVWLPAEVNNLSQEEGGTKHCEDGVEREPGCEEDGALHLHTPRLQVVRHSSHQKTLFRWFIHTCTIKQLMH